MRNKRAENTTDMPSSLRRKWLALEILAVCVALAALALAVAYVRLAPPVQPTPPPAPPPAVEGVEIDVISEWAPAYITVYYPRTENERVNRAVRAFADEQIARFRDGARPGARGKDELAVSVRVSRFDDDIVSFLFRGYTRYAGEASGRDSIDTMTFDLTTGERLELAALFREAEEFLPALSHLAFDGATPAPEDYACFTLDGDVLRLNFVPAETGANGAEQADIALADLRPLLAPRLLKPIRGGVVDPAYTEPETEPTTQPPAPAIDIEALRGKKIIALTFDDGPHGVFTLRLLDFLKEQDVRATFFMLGCMAEYYPDIPRRAAAEGHQVASHTYSHKNLTQLGPERLAREIERTNVLLESLTGARPTAMRPPFGEQNAAVQAAAGVPVVLWSVDPRDWSTRDADQSYSRIMDQTRDGSIILLHDVYAETIEAAERIIPALKAQGYTFVTVDELLAVRGEAKPGDVVRNRP